MREDLLIEYATKVEERLREAYQSQETREWEVCWINHEIGDHFQISIFEAPDFQSALATFENFIKDEYGNKAVDYEIVSIENSATAQLNRDVGYEIRMMEMIAK